MSRVKERFVVDEKGNKTEVVLSVEHYESLLKELEEPESIRAFDAAMTSSDEAVPAKQACAETALIDRLSPGQPPAWSGGRPPAATARRELEAAAS